jgi:serine/threonine protein kinase
MDSRQDNPKARKKIGHYIVLDMIGKGEFGVVHSAISTVDNQKYAIKCQEKKFIQDNDIYRKLLNTEIGIMHKIIHPNILHLYDLMESPNNYYLIVDFCNQGDFNYYMKAKGIKYLHEKEAVYFLKQIMNGFRELRKHKIIHRDFKLSNLLVHNEILKIGDFGLAKKGHEFTKTIVGTYMTMAPELLSSDGKNLYTAKADLWSIGFVYYQMLFGDYPFFGLSPSEIHADIRAKTGNLSFKYPISMESKDLLNRLLRMNPDERIDWPEFFNHPLFMTNFPTSLRNFVKPVVLDNENKNHETSVEKEFIKNKKIVLEDKNARRDNSRDLRHERGTSHTPSTTPDKNVPLVPAKNINEEIPDEGEISHLQRIHFCKEVARRYYHEKNKILFIVYTVRNIRKLMKIDLLEEVHDSQYVIAIFLLKKAIVLNDLNLMSLLTGNNVFEQSGFSEFMNSEYFETVANNFKTDQPNFSKYMTYLLDNSAGLAKAPDMQTKLDLVNQEIVSLSKLDELISEEYTRIKNLQIDENPELCHEYILMMVSIFYSIECETYFPYKVNNEKFEWNEFYDQHEKMSDEELLVLLK